MHSEGDTESTVQVELHCVLEVHQQVCGFVCSAQHVFVIQVRFAIFRVARFTSRKNKPADDNQHNVGTGAQDEAAGEYQ